MYLFVYDMSLSLNGSFFVAVDHFHYEVPARHSLGDTGKAREIPAGNIFPTGMQLFPIGFQHSDHGLLWLFSQTFVCF